MAGLLTAVIMFHPIENRYQTEMVPLIPAKKADYFLALKTNHPTLHAQVKNWFDKAGANNFPVLIFLRLGARSE